MEGPAVEFLKVLSLVAGGGLWPPAAPVPSDPATLALRILAIVKGTPIDQVEDRLALTGCAASMHGGTVNSHFFTYSVGRTHALVLSYGRGKDGWEFHAAQLEVAETDWSLPWKWSPRP
jgi:hypothetical protein